MSAAGPEAVGAGGTARYLVIGAPVAHSLSPAMMNAAFAAAGLEAAYAAREIPTRAWPGALDALRAEGVAGMNVTVPHKESALAGAVQVSRVARAIGAANTLVAREDGWHADNTDGPGFLDWARERGLAAALRREVLVLGAGGSARAVVWALLEAGCPRIRLANRTRARAEALAVAVGGARGRRIAIEPLPVPGRSAGIAPKDGLIVHATSAGLRPGDPSRLRAVDLAGAAAVLDLVYPDPPLVREARAAGVRAADGRGLLVAQGARSFGIWTGRDADRPAMREAIEAELARRRSGA